MDVKLRTATTLAVEDPIHRLAGIGLLCAAALFLVLALVGALGLFAGLLSLCGAGLFLIWGLWCLRPSRVVFDADLGRMCVERWFLRTKRWTVPLSTVTEISLLLAKDSDGGPDGYQVVAATDAGDIQLSFSVADEVSARETFKAIADFFEANALPATFPEKPKARINMHLRPPDAREPDQ